MVGALQVFDLVAALGYGSGSDTDSDDDTIHKSELVRAQGGDFGLFAGMDIDGDGKVTREEWVEFLGQKYQEKGDRGAKWLTHLLNTMCINLADLSTSSEETGSSSEEALTLVLTLIEPNPNPDWRKLAPPVKRTPGAHQARRMAWR